MDKKLAEEKKEMEEFRSLSSQFKATQLNFDQIL